MNKPEKSNEVIVLCKVIRLFLKYLTIFSLTSVLASAQAQGNTISDSSNASLMSLITTLILDEDDEPIGPYPTTQGLGPEPAIPLPAAAKSLTRKTAYEYDSATGLLIRQVIEPDNPQLRVELSYPVAGYDNYGNPTVMAVSSPATGTSSILSRSLTTVYDSRGRFATQITNALGHTTAFIYDGRFGGITKVVDANQQNMSVVYDDFGRVAQQTQPDGTQLKWDYLYCIGTNGGSTACPTEAKYVVVKTPYTAGGSVNGSWEKTFYDVFERVVETNTVGFDESSIIRSTVKYDQNGNVYQVSRPYFSSQSPVMSTYYYDVYDRITTAEDPSGKQTIYAYDGQTISVTNALKQTTTYISDVLGRLVTVKDSSPEHNALNYRYDPLGNLTHTVDSSGNTTSMAYNLLGHKLQMVDPDMGSWMYESDVLGNVVRQIDAKGQIATYGFDRLGRLTNRNENDLVSSWTYDSCERGVGAICNVASNNGYTQKYAYDTLGRVKSLDTKIDANYASLVTYDSNGRTSTLTYPGGLVLRYGYTGLGYLKEVRNNATNALYWSANEMDAEGNVLQQTYGNGLVTQRVFDKISGRLKNIYAGIGNGVQNLSFVYDDLGNVINRTDTNQGLNESFLYDALQRVTSTTVNSGAAGIQNRTYDYDSIGNIKYSSDKGIFISGSKNARPHGVYKISDQGQGSQIFSYDANGNMLGDSKYDANNQFIYGTTRKLTYTSFNMPAKITGQNSTVNFNYGANYQRTRMDSPSGTKIYVHPDNSGGLMFEKEIKRDQSVVFNNYISVGGLVIALVKQSNAGLIVNYMHQDHLGSISAITDEAGSVAERLSYEAFGKRRMPSGAQANLTGGVTARGFTTAEHLEEFGLIHLNGRVYDPQIGRFISADPGVPYPDNMQSFNRYSYVRNNPLAFVDPSGYQDNFFTSTPIFTPGSGAGNIDLNFTWGAGRSTKGGKSSEQPAAPNTAAPTDATPSLKNIQVVNLTSGDIYLSHLAGAGNQMANIAVNFANLLIAMSPSDADLIPPVKPFTPTSNYFGQRGGEMVDGLLTAAGGSGFGFGISGRGVSGVWNLHRFERGWAIERMLGQNMPQNMETIDRWTNGIVTSIKSVDLNAKTYQNQAKLNRLLKGYIDKLKNYQGTGKNGYAGVRIESTDIKVRALDLAVPGRGTPMQQSVLQNAAEYAESVNVKLNIIIIK